MDNTLYIVAGLVVVLLVAILLQRRQKAQRPPSRSSSRATKVSSRSRRSVVDDRSDVADADLAVTKFDELAVAQRFIDQQRYDKAIEALNRGLATKPSDAGLLLKLLNIYATISDFSAFESTYNAIITQGNPETVAQAQQLKSLLDDEQGQTAQILARNESTGDTASRDSLDFDLQPSQSTFQSTAPNAQIVDSSSDKNIQRLNATENANAIDVGHHATSSQPSNVTESADGIFDLTLDDLETDDLSAEFIPLDTMQTDESIRLDAFSSTDNSGLTTGINSTEASTIKPNIDASNSANPVNNIDEEFSFMFEDEDDAESAINPLVVNDFTLESTEEVEPFNATSDDDFALDFEGLSAASKPVMITDAKADNDAEGLDFDLDFDYEVSDDFIASKDTSSMNEKVNQLNNDNDLTEFDSLDFKGFENLDHAEDSLDIVESTSNKQSAEPVSLGDVNSVTDATAEDSQTIATHNEVRFDDNTLFDDDTTLFDDNYGFVDTAVSDSMPVTADEASQENGLLQPDFATQFSKDFSFVTDLDSSQVTLDLAAKYLELGEYDSAKRLLNEVVSKGNNDQQASAQRLLARTA